MTDYYVDFATGSDLGGSGTKLDPWKNPWYAKTQMSNGDKCWMKNTAAYTEEDTDGAANDCLIYENTGSAVLLSFEGYETTEGDNGVAVLNAGTEALTNVIHAPDSTNHQYIYKNVRFTGASSHGATTNCQRTNFINCRFDSNGGYGCNVTGYSVQVGCLYENNTSAGHAGGTYVFIVYGISRNNGAINTALITFGNVYYDTTMTAGLLRSTVSHSWGRALHMSNVFDGRNGSYSGLSSLSGSHAGTVLNNIFFDCNVGIDVTSNLGDLNYIDYNFFFSNGTDVVNCVKQENCVDGTEDPFVDSVNHDYRLKNDSEAEAVGLDVGDVWDFWEGTSLGGFMDVGAIQREAGAYIPPVLPAAATANELPDEEIFEAVMALVKTALPDALCYPEGMKVDLSSHTHWAEVSLQAESDDTRKNTWEGVGTVTIVISARVKDHGHYKPMVMKGDLDDEFNKSDQIVTIASVDRGVLKFGASDCIAIEGGDDGVISRVYTVPYRAFSWIT